MHAILPAAGNATRLRKLPKFLLPIDKEAKTLLERHIEILEPIVDIIWFPIKPDLIPLIIDLGFSEKLICVPMKTKTMTETILKTCELSGSKDFLMTMPDTYFTAETPSNNFFENLGIGTDLNLNLWSTRDNQRGKVGGVELNSDLKVVNSVDKDPNSRLKFHWGSMYFNLNFVNILDEKMPHPGYAINKALERQLKVSARIMSGEYFDCGTFDEYKNLLNCLN